jgi:hypothetical protein
VLFLLDKDLRAHDHATNLHVNDLKDTSLHHDVNVPPPGLSGYRTQALQKSPERYSRVRRVLQGAARRLEKEAGVIVEELLRPDATAPAGQIVR